MALREEFVDSGNWLFRWRSYLPLVMLLFFFFSMQYYTIPFNNDLFASRWEICCMLVSMLGLSIRAATIGYTPKGTSGRNTKKQVANSINTKGIYSVVRHPLYLGNFFMILGIALYTFIWWLVIIYILSFWIYYERIMYAEESFLRSKFKEAFIDWSQRTNAFIPSFKNYQKSDMDFSFKNILKREYHGFFAIIMSLYIFKLVGHYVIANEIIYTPNMRWKVLLLLGCLIWITCRVLKKFTKVLNVQGR